MIIALIKIEVFDCEKIIFKPKKATSKLAGTMSASTFASASIRSAN